MAAELLAPAGSREAFIGALNAGADAFYLGGEKFGARAYAENFTKDEIVLSIREAHRFGKKIYLTANVLTRENELQDTIDFVKELYREGLDGVIVQDLGVLMGLRKSCPGLLLHASTQMSVTAAEGVRYLKKLGVSRIVPARELSLEEIRLLKNEDIEIEAFIHGAMCYSYSGRCLFSSFLGGRSGNRGRCAGTCRLPFEIFNEKGESVTGKKETFPISMKDMSVITILPDLLDAGIDSLKIEGRMKRPEYAAGVASIYRKYLDRYDLWNKNGRKEPWKVEKEDLRFLSDLYIRTDRSTGYYGTRNGRSLITMGKPGYAGADDLLLKQIGEKYLHGIKKLPLQGMAVLKSGLPAELYLYTTQGGIFIQASARGEIVQKAQNRPLEEKQVADRLSKMGETPFFLQDMTVDMEKDVFLPIAALNNLRREAAAELEAALLAEEEKRDRFGRKSDIPEEMGESEAEREKKRDMGRGIIAQVSSPGQYRAAVAAGVTSVIIEGNISVLQKGVKHYLALPAIFREFSRTHMERFYREALTQRCDGIMVRTLEELDFLMERNYPGCILADASLYRWNHKSDRQIMRSCDYGILPYELNARQMEDTFPEEVLSEREILTVYGRIPLMISAGCLRKTCGACRGNGESYWSLQDRMHERFPVHCICGEQKDLCHNVIYNGTPLSLHQFMQDDLMHRIKRKLCIFTTETEEETFEILKFYRKLEQGETAGADLPLCCHKFTNGHYKRGAI